MFKLPWFLLKNQIIGVEFNMNCSLVARLSPVLLVSTARSTQIQTSHIATFSKSISQHTPAIALLVSLRTGALAVSLPHITHLPPCMEPPLSLSQVWNSYFSSLLKIVWQKLYVTPQGETGHNSLKTKNMLWLSDDEAWNYLPNAFCSIRLS